MSDLEDRGAAMSCAHSGRPGEIRAGFRRGPGRRAEIVAAEIVLDQSSYLDLASDQVVPQPP